MGSFGFSKSEEKVLLVEEVIEAGKEPVPSAGKFFYEQELSKLLLVN